MISSICIISARKQFDGQSVNKAQKAAVFNTTLQKIFTILNLRLTKAILCGIIRINEQRRSF